MLWQFIIKLCQSCIGSSFVCLLWGFPVEEPILFLSEKVEPFRVHHYFALKNTDGPYNSY